MTCYNREDYIAEAIESVLASTYKDFELIISDDASTDKTPDIIYGYASKDNRVKVFVNEKNLGDYFNRNKAASYASGKYLKYLDSDDVIYSHGLAVFVESMEQFPEAAFGLSAPRDPMVPYPVCISPKQIYLEHFSGYTHFFRAPGSSIIRRDVFEKTGGFSGKRWIGDTELWLKLAAHYNMVKIHADLYWSRPHPQQEGSMFKTETLRAGEKILEEYLQHPDCPLNHEEIKSVNTKLKRRKLKEKLLNTLFYQKNN